MPATATNLLKAPPISEPVPLQREEGLGRGFSATEFNFYGSSRIGMVTQPEALSQKQNDTLRHTQTLGLKVYEFSNHLGNVLTTFSDRKIAVENISDHGNVAYYTSEILSSNDYYPFGFQMPGRVYEADGYRYGFNSMEKDDELKGSGNSYDFGARIYDPRVGRWLSIDPLQSKYAYLNPYHFTANNPIFFADLDGKDFTYSIDEKTKTIIIRMTVFTINNETYSQALAGAEIWNNTNFISQGYTVKFDIQVVAPPAIAQSEVEKANIKNEKLYTKKGEKTRAYNRIERELQNEQMKRDAKDAYDNGEIGQNNVYAGSNDFEVLTLLIDTRAGGEYDQGISNGKRIITYKSIQSVPIPTTPNSTSLGNQDVTIDNGTLPYVVGHELGHNLGLPDYTKQNKVSNGIMDYITSKNGKPSQIEIDDLINRIFYYNNILKSTPQGTKNPQPTGTHGNAEFKNEDQLKKSE